MEKIIETSKTLATLLKDNEDYKQYLVYLDKLLKDEQLVAKVKEFKDNHLEFTKRCEDGYVLSFTDEQFMGNLYSHLMLNEVTKNFMLYESKVFDMINSVYEIIGDSIDIKVDF